MSNLADMVDGTEDVLRPDGELDVLPYYGLIAGKLTGFLHGRELASKIWTPHGRVPVVTISSLTAPPFYVEQLTKAVTRELVEAREKSRNRDEAGRALSPEQRLAWQYFPRRRYEGLYYSVNRMGPGREIDRVVYDVSRCAGSSLQEMLNATQVFTEAVASDDRYPDLFRRDPFVYWTGHSFQVMLFTREPQPASFYRTHVEYTGKGRTWTDRWIAAAARSGDPKITGGTQRRRGYVLIDPSQTPSGKLCPVPVGCLQMTDATTLEGVSVPLTRDMLEKEVLSELTAYTPERIVEELDELTARVP